MDTRPRTPLISLCTVQLRTFCPAHSLATLCLFTTSGPDPGEFPGFWGSMVFRHAPSLERGRVINNNNIMLSLSLGRLCVPALLFLLRTRFHCGVHFFYSTFSLCFPLFRLGAALADLDLLIVFFGQRRLWRFCRPLTLFVQSDLF